MAWGGAGDGFGKAAFGDHRRRSDAWIERTGRVAEQAAQRGRGVGAEPRGDIRHWARREVADRLEPGADERGRRLAVEFERSDGQAADRGGLVRGGACLITREGAGGVGGGAKRMAQRHAEPGQAPIDIVDQSCLAIEQMGTAGDVEDQPVGGIERDERGVARTALGEPVEPGMIENGIVRHDGKVGHLRPRVGERHADAKPERLRAGIDACEAQRTALLLGKDEGEVRRLRHRAGEPLGGQPREEQRQIAPRP